MASTKIILLLASICVLFWFWIGLKGIISRQIKSPYLLILFFCVSIIIAIAKSYEMNTQNNAFFYVTTFEIITLAGIYLFLKLENFWEKIDNIFDEDTILSVSQKSFIGSGLIRKIISKTQMRELFANYSNRASFIDYSCNLPNDIGKQCNSFRG